MQLYAHQTYPQGAPRSADRNPHVFACLGSVLLRVTVGKKNTVFEKGPLITNHHHPLWLVMGHTKGIFACHSPSSNFGKDQTFRRRPAGQKGELERGSPHFKPRPTYNLPVVWPIISSQPLPVMAKKTERARWNRWRPGGPFLASPKKTSRGASTSYASRGGEEKHRPADVRGSPRLRRRGV